MLYNDVRPHTFDEIVGQRNIVKGLRNQSIKDRFFQTYIFSGQYGSGKTTMARIMAMAANCTHKDVKGNPCCKCAACKAIIGKSAIDFVEIDGASNTGVDQVREIISDASFNPVYLRRKVICIDEVHMLSASAFNALLKTLEEPPEGVIFILCTTALNKIPDTVLSRAACYSFERISREDISGQLKKVCENQGIEFTENGIALIARRSDGSMRNALSILEQCTIGGEVSVSGIRDLLGIVDTQLLIKLLSDLIACHQKEAIELINPLFDGDPIAVVTDLSDILRDVILDKMGSLMDGSAEYRSDIHAVEGDLESLVALSDVLIGLRDNLRAGYGREIVKLELIKYIIRTDRISLLENEVRKLKKFIQNGSIPQKGAEEIVKAPDVECTAPNGVEQPETDKDCQTEEPEQAQDEVASEAAKPLDDLDVFCEGLGLDFFSLFDKPEEPADLAGSSEEPNEVSAPGTAAEKESGAEGMSALPLEFSRIAEGNATLNEALEGCVVSLEGDVAVVETPHMAIIRIITDAVRENAIAGMEVRYNPNVRI